MQTSEIGGGEQFALFSRRNSSISSTGRLLVFGSLAFVTFAISLGFAFRGAWPMLPFAGLECLALYLAYRWLQVHDDDYESITIAGGQVIVQARIGAAVAQNSFSCDWAQVVVESGSDGRSSVLLRSHGRQVEVGCLLSGPAKLAAARQLRQKISDRAFDIDRARYRGKT